MDEIITLDYGSGGKKTSRLIENMLLPAFSNPALESLGDGAILNGAEKLVFSTDSFVVSPLFFPGGDVGKLAVCGTVNDVAVCGGVPKYLSCALVIEEGFETKKLEKIIASMSAAAKAAGVEIVTGDTKVVERGRGDGVYINTAGIGFLKYPGLSPKAIRPGDAVLVSGTVGDHGTAVMLARSGMMLAPWKKDKTLGNRVGGGAACSGLGNGPGWNLLCIDYSLALTKGLDAMIAECDEELQNNRYFGKRSVERGITLQAMKLSLQGLVNYAKRFSALAAEMVAKAEEKGLCYGIDMNHRFTPAARQAKNGRTTDASVPFCSATWPSGSGSSCPSIPCTITSRP